MTKYEAFEAIAGVSEDQSWIAYRDEILKILDQIDQPPAEFSVREMVELMKHDPHSQYTLLQSNGNALIRRMSGHADFNVDDIDSLRAKLVELAKPSDPKTVMVELPTKVVGEYANLSANIGSTGETLKAACKTALEKAGVKL